MKKHIIFMILVCVFAGAKTQTVTAITDFDWLAGNWKMDAGEVQIYESWTKGPDNAYHGKGFVIKGKDTIVTEVLKIEKVGAHWVYIAQINNYSPVLFTLTATSTLQNLVFENPEHDNPQRIIYKQVSKNEIFARTEATVDGQLAADDYNYTRY